MNCEIFRGRSIEVRLHTDAESIFYFNVYKFYQISLNIASLQLGKFREISGIIFLKTDSPWKWQNPTLYSVAMFFCKYFYLVVKIRFLLLRESLEYINSQPTFIVTQLTIVLCLWSESFTPIKIYELFSL